MNARAWYRSGPPRGSTLFETEMSLSLYRMPDGQSKSKGQSELPCPSVYAPTSALRSLSSVALSSAPATKTLSRSAIEAATTPHFSKTLSSTFLFEATNLISSTFLREAIGKLFQQYDFLEIQHNDGEADRTYSLYDHLRSFCLARRESE